MQFVGTFELQQWRDVEGACRINDNDVFLLLEGRDQMTAIERSTNEDKDCEEEPEARQSILFYENAGGISIPRR